MLKKGKKRTPSSTKTLKNSTKHNVFTCSWCGEEVDVVNEFYYKSVTHNIYMHLPCSSEHERMLRLGKIKLYQAKP